MDYVAHNGKLLPGDGGQVMVAMALVADPELVEEAAMLQAAL